MISFRYHLVSIVAVFLALGLGILAGTTVINQQVVKGLKSRTKAAERDVASYRRQLFDIRDQVGDLQGFIKDATPFLLRRVVEMTGGRSLTANIALVKHNAALAAAIARALAATA